MVNTSLIQIKVIHLNEQNKEAISFGNQKLLQKPEPTPSVGISTSAYATRFWIFLSVGLALFQKLLPATEFAAPGSYYITKPF